MKRLFIILAILIPLSDSLFAQGAFTIGCNYWRAKPDLEAESLQNADISDGNMFGPYLNYRSGKLILGGSYFVGNFDVKSTVLMPSGEAYYFDGYYYYDAWGNIITYSNVETRMTLQRQDLNASVGYALNNNVTVFGALKNVNGKLTDYKVDGQSSDLMEDYKYKGTLFGGGISLVYAFPQSPVFLFGSAAYLAGTIKYSLGGEELDLGDAENQDVTSITAGAGYRLSPQWNVLVGYRQDVLSSKDADTTEKYKGITVSLGYTIRQSR